MTDGQRDPGLGQNPRPVVAGRSLPGKPDRTGEDFRFVPSVQVRPVETSVGPGPQRCSVMSLDLQKVGESLVETDIQDRGAPWPRAQILGREATRSPKDPRRSSSIS